MTDIRPFVNCRDPEFVSWNSYMSFLPSFLKPAAPKVPEVPSLQIPTQLPKISAPTAAQIAQSAEPSAGAKTLLTPQQTPSQYLNALQQKHMGPDMVKTLAHGMPDREGVHWAAQSAEKVSEKLPPHELDAMKAAQAWVKNPTPANQTAASAAAAKTNFQGPGAWAAQGAAWAQPATATPGAGAAPAAAASAAARLTPHAVSGAVLSAAAIKANPALALPAVKAPAMQMPTLAAPTLQAPQLAAPQAPQTPPPTVPPAVQAQTFKEQHPFIALGLDVATGKNSWV
jgi:hypothetical protein